MTQTSKAQSNPPVENPKQSRQPAAEEVLPKIDWMDFALYPFFFVGFLGVLLVFEVIQRIAILFGYRGHDLATRGLNFWVLQSLKIVGTRLSVTGYSPLKPGVPYIILSNHQSMFDISAIHHVFRSHAPRFVSKVELARGIPSVSYCIRNDGSAIIDRKDATQAIPEIKRMGTLMRERSFASVLFPEGTRARSGEMKKFRVGGFSALLEACPEAEVLPIALDNTWKLTARKKGPVPRSVHIRLNIGTPLQKDNKSAKELIAEAELQVQQLLDEIRR